MCDRYTADRSAYSYVACRVVHRVLYVAVLKVINNLVDSHLRTVLFRFHSGSTEMRCDKCVLCMSDSGGNKVRDVFLYFAGFQPLDYRFFIYQCIAGEVEENNAFLHLADGFLADHAARVVRKRHMDGDVITVAVNLVDVSDVTNAAGKTPCCLNGDERIVTEDFHTEVYSCICNHNTDGTETDDTQFFSINLIAGELLLLFLHLFSQIFCALLLFKPLNSAYDVAGRKKHTCYDKLLDTVCIGTRCIEYNNSLFRAFIERDVVYACTCAGDRDESIRQFHVLHIGTSDENSISFRDRVSFFKVIWQMLEPHFRNVIQAMIGVHFFIISSCLLSAGSFDLSLRDSLHSLMCLQNATAYYISTNRCDFQVEILCVTRQGRFIHVMVMWVRLFSSDLIRALWTRFKSRSRDLAQKSCRLSRQLSFAPLRIPTIGTHL